MTRDEYQRICERIAKKAIRFAEKMAADEKVVDKDVACPKCERPAGEPCKFPVWSDHDAPEHHFHPARSSAALEKQSEHWIDVYLDEHLPDVDADALLEVTTRADAFEKAAGRPAPSREVAARHAFQADVWHAITGRGSFDLEIGRMTGYCHICKCRYVDCHVCEVLPHQSCTDLLRKGLAHLICTDCKRMRE